MRNKDECRKENDKKKINKGREGIKNAKKKGRKISENREKKKKNNDGSRKENNKKKE